MAFDFKPNTGGVATYGHELALALSKHAQVTVVAKKLPRAEEFDQQQPYRIQRFDLYSSALLSLWHWSDVAASALKAVQPDAVIAPLWFPDGAAVRLAKVKTGMKTPYAVSLHGMEISETSTSLKDVIRRYLLKNLKFRTFDEASSVFAVSRHSGQLLMQQMRELNNVKVINNGVNNEIFKRDPSQAHHLLRRFDLEEKNILLSVCRLMPHKGIDVALQAVQKLVGTIPDLRYVIVGDGPDKARLLRMVVECNLQDHVIFTGAIEQNQLVQLYNNARLFLLPSRETETHFEGFGLVFLEAAACGLPAVAGNSGGIPDAIEDGKTGWLVPPEDPEAIAKKIKELFDEPVLIENASRQCLEKTKEKSWDIRARQCLEVLFG